MTEMAVTTTIPRQRTTGRRPAKRDAAVPHAGLWVLDPGAATVAFTGKASRLAPTVGARFGGVTGSVLVLEDATASVVDVEVDLRTMTSGTRAWDDLVAALDPFEVGRFPTATYRSSGVRWHGDSAEVTGELVLRGVARSVPLTARYAVLAGGKRLALTAEGVVNRSDFGIRCEVPGAALIIPRLMTLQIAVEAGIAG
jgi:polyisoprenoid-binding protein YceI